MRALLPGANCGGCGRPSCDAFASALVAGQAEVNGCLVNTMENRKKLGALLGMTVQESEPVAANGACAREIRTAARRGLTTKELNTCLAADVAAKGIKGCEQACLGLGDCVRVCAFDAISVQNGVAKVDYDKCTACGCCERACPRSVIRLLPAKTSARVLCRTRLSPRDARKTCKNACIKCQLCIRNCPEDAISMVDGLVVVDQGKCTACGICQQKCPTGAIIVVGRAGEQPCQAQQAE